MNGPCKSWGPLLATCVLLVFAGVPAFPQDASPADRDQRLLPFLSSRGERSWPEVPRKVLAFYYTWYGRPGSHGRWVHWKDVRPQEHEIASSTHFPALGAYDSHDPELIDQHIEWARSCGVDAFICTWWGQSTFDDRALRIVLDRAARKNFEISVYWESVPGQGEAKIARAVNDLTYLLEHYGEHPAFLRVSARPVIFVYGRVMGQVTLDEWPQIITRARARCGRDFLLIADGYREGFARLFDGVHTYNTCGAVRGKDATQLGNWCRGAFARAVALARRRGKIACLTVIPGYDDTKIRKPGLRAERREGAVYRIQWEQALAADPDWVLITSWNEWHEGSEIEPSWEEGDRYLQLTRSWSARFKKLPRRERAAAQPLPAATRARVRALRALYADTTVGVLPGFSGRVVFWLLDAGIHLRELRWEELLDEHLFHPKRIPVVLNAGGESYTQTVRERGDVDRALERYLEQGGLLVAMTSQPLPFFYNERGEAVGSAARFGLPLTQGWERPAANARLTFHFDQHRLVNLPASAPFPAEGDLRWRPARAGSLAREDLYLPLAGLRDSSGESLGDGIAYCEHRASPPRGARILYVWMRMPDIVDADELFLAIFRLAGEHRSR